MHTVKNIHLCLGSFGFLQKAISVMQNQMNIVENINSFIDISLSESCIFLSRVQNRAAHSAAALISSPMHSLAFSGIPSAPVIAMDSNSSIPMNFILVLK